MSAHTVGSAAWYDVHPEAPTKAEAEADKAAAKHDKTPPTPGPMTDALASWEFVDTSSDCPF